ncbi:MAG: hypothetical protein FWB74_07865 [Defluviitaleaceae bacterium]|nr:hypothetical protein [Defluviitaleaceae bacterium]
MKWLQKGKGVELSNFRHFNIGQILECGQAFRFEKLKDGHYEVVALGRVLNVHQEGEFVKFWYEGKNQLNLAEFESIWVDYFDLERDYGKIQAKITENDPIMQRAVDFAPGIRILRQDPWEMIISFIISQNNRIPQIKQVIKNICTFYGEPIGGGHHAFATPKRLAAATQADLRNLSTGYRDEYIINAARAYTSNEINSDNLKSIKGIGDKVAHCISLFGYGRTDSFPVDVWVRRVMQELYFGGKPVKPAEIQAFARERFGEYAGFAQQYLFHYMRTGYEKESKNEL